MYAKFLAASFAALAVAAPAPQVSQISDGQIQASTGRPVSQITDGQIQASTAAPRPVSQISDGQIQASTGRPVSQISDGQIQASTGKATATGAAVSQISDGQIQAPAGTATKTGSIYGTVSGNVPGYTGANAGFSQTPRPLTTVATVFGPDSQVPAIHTMPPTAGTGAAPPRVSSDVTGATSHGPYSGVPTVTGAVSTIALASSIAPMPLNPTATYYNTNGKLQNPQPAPYVPAGGLGTNGSLPRYMVESDFDFESIALGLYQEWIELDLFNNGLAVFSEADFLAAGLTAEDRSYIQFMAQQESGHATLLTNMLGERAPKQCTYNYPYTTVREFIDFNQRLTRYGESGVWGFLSHLDSREVSQLLSQSIATEARQQMSFRQMLGLHPMPVWFENGIPQSWAWSLLAPYISSCPENNTRLAWQNFPALHIVNNPNPNRFSPNDTEANEQVGMRAADPAKSDIPENESCVNLNVTGYGCGPAIAHNRSEPLSFAGKRVDFMWDAPGKAVGPNNSYITSSSAGAPKFVGWSSQLNFTYTPLTVTGSNTGYTYQPASEVYQGDGAVNGTMFVVLTDTDEKFTAFNLSMVNPHVVALGEYMAG